QATAPAPRLRSHAEATRAARAFAAEIAPGAIERDRERRVPVAELEALGRTGILALGVPVERGGGGASAATIVEVFRIISAADPAIGQVPQNHFMLVDALVRYGDVAQKELLLGEVVRGARFGNAWSERGGQHPLDTKTVLRETDAGLRLEGRKYYSTGALTAQWVPVLARDETRPEEEARCFVYLPREVPGLEVDQDWSAFGQRATLSGTTVLRDVAVRPEWVLRTPVRKSKADTFAAFGQILHAAVDVGIARGALAEAAHHLGSNARAWFEAAVERPGDEPHVVAAFGRLEVRVRAAEALLDAAARALDAAAADPTPALIDAARMSVAAARAGAAETALEVASEALDALGSSAADGAYGLDRHWRNARTHTLHDPTRWKHVHLGRNVLDGVVPGPDNFLI
ncbi:MAG TPA: SfnB family sulfur acquisition oxidoreductase, partial [Solirubrobacterales bacterium]|nr:SfnB family sulfur acquisition oxidoreductase [Solirubrobacterales bacterium]